MSLDQTSGCTVTQNVLFAQLVGADRVQGELLYRRRIDLEDALLLPQRLVFLRVNRSARLPRLLAAGCWLLPPRPLQPNATRGKRTFSIETRVSLFSVPFSSFVLEMARPSMALGTVVSAMLVCACEPREDRIKLLQTALCLTLGHSGGEREGDRVLVVWRSGPAATWRAGPDFAGGGFESDEAREILRDSAARPAARRDGGATRGRLGLFQWWRCVGRPH